MLHLISYLILRGIRFDYNPALEDDGPNILRFCGRERRYCIHEFHRGIYPAYYLLEWDGGKPIISNVTAIELFDVVAALI